MIIFTGLTVFVHGLIITMRKSYDLMKRIVIGLGNISLESVLSGLIILVVLAFVLFVTISIVSHAALDQHAIWRAAPAVGKMLPPFGS